MSEIMAYMPVRVTRELKHSVPQDTNKIYKRGKKELVWCKSIFNSRIGEWIGQFRIEVIDETAKTADIRDNNNTPARPFNVAQFKTYFSPEILACSLISSFADYFRYHEPPSTDKYLFMTEEIYDDDGRAHCAEMKKGKCKKIHDLLRRGGTFIIVLKEELSADANVVPAHFVLSIKSKLDGKIKYKAEFVVGSQINKPKDLMVNCSQTLQPQSIRILLTVLVLF